MSDEPYLTPTQELVMELLAARSRLGECWWTLSKRPAITTAVNALEDMGYVIVMSPQVQNTLRVQITSKGCEAMICPQYTDPRAEAWDKGYSAGSRDYAGTEHGEDVNNTENPWIYG